VSRDPRLEAALAPLRSALLATAQEDADRRLREADEAAHATQAESDASVARGRAAARSRGAADAAAAVTQQRSRAGARARSILLEARREEYLALKQAARSAMAALRDDPSYPAMRERMADAVRRRLGPQAQIDDADGGGVLGRAPGRRVDYSLASLADQAADEVAAELESR
jgi:vacuolar-type H+-ATPase subunit E/Vma4